MDQPVISIYPRISVVDSTETTPLDLFLSNIQSGLWQDIVLPIRAIRDKEERQRRKKTVPYVTISGIFPHRDDKGCKQHSGLLGVDIDDVGDRVEEYRALLSNDPYCYALFTSISGTGLCMLVKIDGDRHRDAFAGIAAHMIQKYQIVVDPTAVNPSRPRYVSYDPDLYTNTRSLQFKSYPAREKKRKSPAVVYVATEFEDLLNRMVQQRVECCEAYMDWLRVGFALADKMGERGREWYHALSAISGKYEYEASDKMYDACLKGSASEKRATIGTIYYFAKQAGLDITSPTTRKISSATTSLKRSGLSPDAIITNLAKFEGIDPDLSREVVEAAYQSTDNFSKEESTVEAVRTWLKTSFDFRRNIITGRIECADKPMEDEDFNTVYIEAKIIFPDLTFELFSRVLHSNNIPSYNPFIEFYNIHKDHPYNNEIARLWACVTVDNDEKLSYFGTKWLVSIVASIYGTHSPIMLVLAGEEQNTGKTEFFRRLPPQELIHYYAESKLDAGKDDEILMTQKLIIMDDEMGGKSKKDAKRLKELISKQTFSLRKPFGRTNVDINRIAVLCGTSNDLQLLNDPTGNRRIIPVQVQAIDFAAYNSIDKTALLIELFRMYKDGFDWRLGRDDIKLLSGETEVFQEFTLEYELINQYYELPTGTQCGESSATEIKVLLEAKSGQKLSLKKLGEELNRIGFKSIHRRVNGKTAKLYQVNEKTSTDYKPFVKDTYPF